MSRIQTRIKFQLELRLAGFLVYLHTAILIVQVRRSAHSPQGERAELRGLAAVGGEEFGGSDH